MLYYTTLFLIVVLVSMVAIWMYRAIFGVGRSVYKSNLKNGKKLSKKAQARLNARRKQWAESEDYSSSEVPTPWGWKGSSNHPEAGYMDSYAAKPREPASTRKSTGWPYKEEKVEFAGKAYKVNRKAADEGKVGPNGKPWV